MRNRIHHRKAQSDRAVIVSISLPLWLKIDAEHQVSAAGLRGLSELVQLRLRAGNPTVSLTPFAHAAQNCIPVAG
jgi:hypothetical protein